MSQGRDVVGHASVRGTGGVGDEDLPFVMRVADIPEGILFTYA